MATSPNLVVREPSRNEIDWLLDESIDLGGPVIVSSGRLYELSRQELLIAVAAEEPVGFVAFRCEGEKAEVLAIKSLHRQHGIGTTLLAHVEDVVRRRGVGEVVLVTTNDNTDALRFYQRRGYQILDFQRNAFRDVLLLKGLDPNAVIIGQHGIVVRDVIVLAKQLRVQ